MGDVEHRETAITIKLLAGRRNEKRLQVDSR